MVRVQFHSSQSTLIIHTSRGPAHRSHLECSALAKVTDARRTLEEDLKSSLLTIGSYPAGTAETFHNVMAWNDGYNALCESIREGTLTALVIEVGEESALVLPEMIPVTENHKEIPLVNLVPSARIIDHVNRQGRSRPPANSLAILYQSGESQFEEMAEAFRAACADAFLFVDTYPGKELAGGRRLSLLREIFHTHSAVVFVGHLERRPDGTGGWKLDVSNNGSDVLLMDDLKAFFGQPDRQSSNCVPDLVCALSCQGSWGDPVKSNGSAAFYPRIFLDAGVQLYLGPFMDLIFPTDAQKQREAKSSLVQCLSSFLNAWVGDPSQAANHLFEAKRKLNFPLLENLFQMYAFDLSAAGLVTADDDGGTQLSSISEGDQLGTYMLRKLFCEDAYGRTFFAAQPGGPEVLIQVLTLAGHGRQNQALEQELKSALASLQTPVLGGAHLVPSHFERLALVRGGYRRRDVPALVISRPSADLKWQTLEAWMHKLDRTAPEHFAVVLEIGAQLASALSELHARGIAHGNIGPSNVLIGEAPGRLLVVLKDAWLSSTRSEHFIADHYAAPIEGDPGGRTESLKQDCWSVGQILFTLASGQQPSPDSGTELPGSLRAAVAGNPDLGETVAQRVPAALNGLVNECLTPSVRLRPTASELADRLRQAQHTGGSEADRFAQELDLLIQAGHRLFVTCTDDLDELLESLVQFCKMSWPSRSVGADSPSVVRYHLYDAAEGVGLRDLSSGERLVDWQEVSGTSGGEPDVRLTQVHNAWRILARILTLSTQESGEQAVVLVRGGRWLQCGSPGVRALRMLQASPKHSPAIIAADFFLPMDSELARDFIPMAPPWASRAVLFERIRKFASEAGLPAVKPEEAVRMALALYPCSRRDLTQLLRLGMLEHRAIDMRITEARDNDRKQAFMSLGVSRFTPLRELPDPECFAFPSNLGPPDRIYSWAQSIAAARTPPMAPQRLLITGPGGCGKTALAGTLAALTRLPLVTVNAANCLRGEIGSSEALFSEMLGLIMQLGRAVVLFDNMTSMLEQTQPVPEQPLSALPVMERLNAMLLHWMDRLRALSGLAVIVTLPSDKAGRCSPQLLRRVEWHMELPAPRGSEQRDYRSRIFAAVFKARGLEELARDSELMDELAFKTDPDVRKGGVPAPIASRARSLQSATVRISTPADIVGWVNDRILYATEHDAPRTAAFWREGI